jgi:hypothetical protein
MGVKIEAISMPVYLAKLYSFPKPIFQIFMAEQSA